ncbi:beta-ketoacyl-[acyl-carrier-protein] synthase family protein [Plantactinospora sp. WMMC1484]|uniref:beta-ketoacyl-[acyl-carrier-protein] synthase family protein n=1 Tax=Plantactinospora sp. WMMC1484 TaxID=3404122 RepID=UPI003BF59EDD
MIESATGQRVAVTGLGVVAPCGVGAEEFWDGLLKPTGSASVRSVPAFDPATYGVTTVQARRVDRFAQFAIAAAAQALVDAGLSEELSAAEPIDGVDPRRVGVILGTGIGGTPTWETAMHAFRDRGPRAVSPLTVLRAMPNSAPAAVSMRWNLQGPCETVATACASGTNAVATAARLIAAGRADVVLAGGAESCLNEGNVAAFTNMRALSPTGTSRPFAANRDGFCLAEGAGVVVLESAAHAKARGARMYAEILGTAATADAHHVTAPAPYGAMAARCMELALADAGVGAAEVSYVNAHGTSTVFNDAAEAAAIGTVFAGSRPAVTSIKGVTGHALGAAGGLEAVSVALSYAYRTLPPTLGTEEPDPALDVDVVLAPRPWEPGFAISNSFAFGGHNVTVVFGPPDRAGTSPG